MSLVDLFPGCSSEVFPSYPFSVSFSASFLACSILVSVKYRVAQKHSRAQFVDINELLRLAVTQENDCDWLILDCFTYWMQKS